MANLALGRTVSLIGVFAPTLLLGQLYVLYGWEEALALAGVPMLAWLFGIVFVSAAWDGSLSPALGVIFCGILTMAATGTVYSFTEDVNILPFAGCALTWVGGGAWLAWPPGSTTRKPTPAATPTAPEPAEASSNAPFST